MWTEEGEEKKKIKDPWFLRALIGPRVSKHWFCTGGFLMYQSNTNYVKQHTL